MTDTPPEVPPHFPSREEILRFIADHPGEAGKREIARAYGIKGSAKILLKRILKELSAEGLVAKRGKRLIRPDDLPPVFVMLITGHDAYGDLVGEPQNWDPDTQGDAPRLTVLADRRRVEGPAPGVGDRALVRVADAPPGMEVERVARVIKVLDRKPQAVLGIVRHLPEGGARIVPVDKKARSEYLVDAAHLAGAEDGDLVAIETGRSHQRFGLPRARVLERIGSMKSERAISMIAIHTHGIPYIFPSEALAEAEAAEPARLDDWREDWRAVPLVTIDPPDAKDHDDAVYAEPDTSPDNPDGFVVHVAIADVAAYVRPASALDREALKRGNSVYFPDHVVPMLPERISTDLCSLKPDVDRPALAVRMIFSAEGRKKSHTFHRVLMRSAAKLAYAQAQRAIDGQTDDITAPILDSILKPLWAAYACLKRGRDAREPLDLDLPERKIQLTPDGLVDRVYIPERLDAHKLIEEFMIQANVAAAETLEQKKVPLLYRIHDSPGVEKMESLREFLQTIDISLPRTGNLRPAQFNRILDRVVDSPNAHLVNEVVLRSQAQAEYAPENIGHFGLNLRRYAHFTSPIRRYADLIVHRGLIRALGLGPGGLPEATEAKLAMIGMEISSCERRAMLAERNTIDRLIALWLSDKVGATFSGRIGGVTKVGLFVKLDDSGADGFVPAASLGADFYVYDESTHALIGKSGGETFRLGDAVRVRLLEAAPFAGALRFEILSDGRRERPAGRRPDLVRAELRSRRGPPRGKPGAKRR